MCALPGPVLAEVGRVYPALWRTMGRAAGCLFEFVCKSSRRGGYITQRQVTIKCTLASGGRRSADAGLSGAGTVKPASIATEQIVKVAISSVRSQSVILIGESAIWRLFCNEDLKAEIVNLRSRTLASHARLAFLPAPRFL